MMCPTYSTMKACGKTLSKCFHPVLQTITIHMFTLDSSRTMNYRKSGKCKVVKYISIVNVWLGHIITYCETAVEGSLKAITSAAM